MGVAARINLDHSVQSTYHGEGFLDLEDLAEKETHVLDWSTAPRIRLCREAMDAFWNCEVPSSFVHAILRVC